MSGNPSILRVNGQPHEVSRVPLHETVLDFLRQRGLTGTKCGCNEGDCGACSVLLLEPGGAPRSINACLAFVHALAGREIRTVEGIAKEGALHPVQGAMVACHGSQCGYCTPGFIASMTEAWQRGVEDDDAISNQLCGNLCRCTGYRPIRQALRQALLEKEGRAAWEAWLQPDQAPAPAVASHLEDGQFFRPATIADALAFKKQHPGAIFVAGATEVAVLVNKRHLRPSVLISLEGVRELTVIRRHADVWEIGGAARMTDIQESLGGEIPALDEMFRGFASRQIRHRATLGGNLATASPIGDSAPLLLALDAVLLLVSTRGEREVPIAEFFTGYRKSVLRPDELIRAIRIPRRPRGRVAFFKVSKRREMDISIVAAGIRIATDDRDRVTEVRLAFGGVAEKPVRALAAETALIGRPLAAHDDLLDLLEQAFTPLDDVRGSGAYRRAVVRGLFGKFVAAEAEEPTNASSAFAGGQGLPHESARGHVTGSARYVHDTALGRPMLEVRAIRSQVARGVLNELDLSAVSSSSGVVAVLTAADIPGANNSGPVRHDEPLLCDGEILFHGQALALVVGESLEACRLAAEKAVVRIEELPPLSGIAAAVAAESFHTDPHVLGRGDVESGLKESPQVLEGEFGFGGQEHFYLETHAAWAEAVEDGVFVASSTQHPSEIQTIVAEVLGIPKHGVVVESPRMGGGFGGKETQGNAIAALCALAAVKTGRPVRWQLDRDEDMTATGKRHPFLARYRAGYRADGTLHALDVRLFSDGGWSLDLSQPVTDRALFHLDNAYYIPHSRFEGRVAKTNTVSNTAFRGFGGPQGMLVIEEILGRIARKLGLPPEEVRRRNFYHGEGETNTTHYGEEIGDHRIEQIWRELLETSEFAERRKSVDAWNASHPHRKRGLAVTPVKFGISFTLTHYNQAGALVLAYADGSVQVNHGGTEMGQGLHTKILGVAMRELGLPAGKIRLMPTRTDKVPNTSATAASSGADLNGMAVADACRQLKERLAPLAAERLGCTAGEIVFADGVARGPGGALPFSELAMLAYTRRVPLSAAGFHATPDLKWDWSVGKGRPFHYFACGAAVSEVEIDGFTGMNKVRRVDILHDVGDSLNPAVDRGQIEGGFVQGMGWLTGEELKWNDQGALLTHSASTYAIPAIGDTPADFRVALLTDATQARTIHGSKAVGEPPLMLAISVREAIRDAVAAFGPGGDFELPSPCTGEAVKSTVDRRR